MMILWIHVGIEVRGRINRKLDLNDQEPCWMNMPCQDI
jgi:hypothetical protein